MVVRVFGAHHLNHCCLSRIRCRYIRRNHGTEAQCKNQNEAKNADHAILMQASSRGGQEVSCNIGVTLPRGYSLIGQRMPEVGFRGKSEARLRTHQGLFRSQAATRIFSCGWLPLCQLASLNSVYWPRTWTVTVAGWLSRFRQNHPCSPSNAAMISPSSPVEPRPFS